MKKLFILFLGLLILSSCKDKEKEKPAILISKITLEPNPATVVTGAKLKLTPALTPGEASNKTLTWESSAPTVATVDSNGEVTGVTPGTATITATAADGSKVTGTTALTVKSNEASVSAITVGDEKLNVAIPTDGATTITLNNAPRTLSSIIKEVPVNITVAAGATIKIGTENFTQGQKVDFSNSKEFKVTAQDGTTAKTYTLAIAAYHSVSNPYGVYTAAHLNDVRNDKAGSYKLMNDLTLPAREEAGAAAATGIEDYSDKGWLPIAHDAVVTFDDYERILKSVTGGFTGTFDGGNFSVNNLYINRTIDFAGLFGVTYEATLKNLNITGTASPILANSRYAGTLAGLICRGSVTDCHAVNFSISLTLLSNYIPGYVGGLVGVSYEGAISKCYAMGSVSSASYAAGGLVGRSYKGAISNCYATGSASASSTLAYPQAGGLAGISDSEISNCYATGNVSASASFGASSAGGLVGNSSGSTISNCYATGNASASSTYASCDAGGLVGTSKSTISNCYATGRVSTTASAASAAGGLVGDSSGSMISNCYTTGSVSASCSSSGGSFAGGLVGISGGDISDCYATGSASATAPDYYYSNSGGLVGRSYKGAISNCYATGSVSASSPNSNAGGLVGRSNEGEISNCYATGSVSISSSGSSYTGGLVGKKDEKATFSNCYRNSDAKIKKNNAPAEPADASTTGITGQSKKDMQTDAFTTSLNKETTVWGRSTGKNDDLPYITGVGVGKI